MLLFDPLRDFFQRRQIVRLDALAGGVQLVNLRSESPRGSFVVTVRPAPSPDSPPNWPR